MAIDPHLADLMRTALHRKRGISEKKMFGGLCWMLNGNMLCGLANGRYMFRVGKELQDEALSRPGASPMDLTGRPMGGLVWWTPTPPSTQALKDGLAWPLSLRTACLPSNRLERLDRNAI